MSFEDKSLKKSLSSAPLKDEWGSPSWERWLTTLQEQQRGIKAYRVDFGTKDVSSTTKLSESISSLNSGDIVLSVNVVGNDSVSVLNSYVTNGELNIVFSGGSSENLSDCLVVVIRG